MSINFKRIIQNMNIRFQTNKKNIDNSKINVKIEKGEALQAEYEFEDSFKIGRNEECQVQILNDTISRFHVEVYKKDNHWWIKDLQSSNGTFVDGERIQEKQLTNNLTVALGIDGPRILLEIESQQKTEATSSPDKRSMTQVMQKYFVDTLDEKVGEHTMMIRHTFRLMQQKQKQKYFKLIAVFIVLCVIIGTYAIFKHLQFNKQVKLAEDNFYNMKVLEVKLVQLETAVTEENGTSLLDQIKSVRLDFYQREETYDQSIGNLGVYKGRVSEENRIILKVARIFGECELNMPPGFVNEVKNYIKKWQSTNRLEKAIKRAEQNSFKHKIVEEMLRYHLPPQFLFHHY